MMVNLPPPPITDNTAMFRALVQLLADADEDGDIFYEDAQVCES
jgi:hypothetical protein